MHFTLVVLLAIVHWSRAFDIQVVAPDDPDFSLVFGRVTFSEFAEILSVTSPAPHLILGDAASKNQLAFHGSLPKCDVPVTVIGKKPDGTLVKVTGKISVDKAKADDVRQGVVVKGDNPKIVSLVDILKTRYTVEVVSNTASTPAGTSVVAIVLRDKSTGTIIPKRETTRIVADEVKNANNGMTVVQPDCSKTCKEICDSFLEHDSAAGLVQTGVVTAGSSRTFVGMPVKWTQKCGKDAFGAIDPLLCGPGTCLNGGICNPNAKSDSNICSCSASSSDTVGPHCEQLTRSYLATKSSHAVTVHTFTPRSTRPESLSFSFEHNGKCQLDSGRLCVILLMSAGGKRILEAQQGRAPEPRYTTATLPATPPDPDKMILYSDRLVQNSRWLDVTVSAEVSGGQIQAKVVFCSKEVKPVCFERKATATFNRDLSISEVTISIGANFNGCFRNVRLNGQLVELRPTSIQGDASLTNSYCRLQDASCNDMGSTRRTCGESSVCYGQLGGTKMASMACSCRCTHSMRMTTERITGATQCSSACSQGAPTISIGASGAAISWAMQDGSFIGLDPRSPLSVEFSLRTGVSDAADMLRAELKSSAGAATLLLKIQGDLLSCCVNSNCFAFAPKPVSDGHWHSVLVRLAGSQLLTRVDDRERIYTAAEVGADGFKLSVRLASSCIRNLRLSEIYMPTSATDGTQDSNAAAIKLTSGSGVTSGSTCADPGPACSCNAATEECSANWGRKTCACKPGFKRYSGSSCTAPPAGNPCTRLGITCPNTDGSCRESAGKWLVCK